MDDDDSKARRNVVIASGLVWLLAWLKVPAAALASKFLSTAGATGIPTPGTPVLDPQRLWLAVLVALIYLGLRYRFSVEGKSASAVIREEWRSAHDILIGAMLGRALWRYTRFGWESGMPQYGLKPLGQRINAEAQDRQGDPKVTDDMRPVFTIQTFKLDLETYEGTVALAPSWHFANAPARKHSGGTTVVKLTGWRKYWLRFLAGLRVVFYSSASIQHLTPWGLLLGAISISVWKLITT